MMKQLFFLLNHTKIATCITAIIFLHGCVNINIEDSIKRINNESSTFTYEQLNLAQSDADISKRNQLSNQLLSNIIDQQGAVKLTLTNSYAMQALLAQGWADSIDAAQISRITNPSLSLERLVSANELELTRSLSFGLLDLLTLKTRTKIAEQRIEQAQLRLSSEVIDHITQVRQAWVRAVAAQESLSYAQRVFESAEAGAELARRMHAIGNLNRINRAREHAFYADAATRLAITQHQVTASRETLIRMLGLNELQAKNLKLPDRLPDLPKTPLDSQSIGSFATQNRLDIRLAQSVLDNAGKAQGLNLITSFTDIELTARSNTILDNASGTRTNSRGIEVTVRLPIFDWGNLQRDAWNARTLAAANQLESTIRSAGSHLRESYSAYRTAFDIAKHYSEEVLPLRRVISEENQLRYNAMLIGVFELLADARDQISIVTAAIDAKEQFWLADAALQASLIGRPINMSIAMNPYSSSSKPEH